MRPSGEKKGEEPQVFCQMSQDTNQLHKPIYIITLTQAHGFLVRWSLTKVLVWNFKPDVRLFVFVDPPDRLEGHIL
jgi:hypothetical protein